MKTSLQDVVSLSKRRGFIFPGSEIYGGLSNTYDFGPLGVELLRNIKNHWWNHFVSKRSDMFGLDSSIIMNSKVWEASGHTASFTDALIDCKNCRSRHRADHIIENFFESKSESVKVEGKSPEQLTKLINENKIKCPKCGVSDWTDAREFNLLFETNIGIVEESHSKAYLRGEIAQGMFINFKNVLDSTRAKLPFGIVQEGKAFRNEITLGNNIFRTLEFNLAEFEYFFDPKESKWEEVFDMWKDEMYAYAITLGLSEDNLRWRLHTDDERSFYSTKTEDLDYDFPFGFKELFGLAYRTDYDLKNHMEKSGVDLRYTDPHDPSNKFIPHVIEPTFGINRIFLALLSGSLEVQDDRTVLHLPSFLAPYQLAVFPLVRNNDQIVNKSKDLHSKLSSQFRSYFDDRGNIGKRYFYQDEAGTPYCVTVDHQTLDDDTVTVRDRDTMKQERISVAKLDEYLNTKLS